MRLRIQIYKDKKKKIYQWRGHLMTGINVIEVSNDSRFYWSRKKYVEEYIEHICKLLEWQPEIVEEL